MLIFPKQLLQGQLNGDRTSFYPVRSIARSVGSDRVQTPLPWVCHVYGRPDIGCYRVVFIEDILWLDVSVEDLELV